MFWFRWVLDVGWFIVLCFRWWGWEWCIVKRLGGSWIFVFMFLLWCLKVWSWLLRCWNIVWWLCWSVLVWVVGNMLCLVLLLLWVWWCVVFGWWWVVVFFVLDKLVWSVLWIVVGWFWWVILFLVVVWKGWRVVLLGFLVVYIIWLESLFECWCCVGFWLWIMKIWLFLCVLLCCRG